MRNSVAGRFRLGERMEVADRGGAIHCPLYFVMSNAHHRKKTIPWHVSTGTRQRLLLLSSDHMRFGQLPLEALSLASQRLVEAQVAEILHLSVIWLACCCGTSCSGQQQSFGRFAPRNSQSEKAAQRRDVPCAHSQRESRGQVGGEPLWTEAGIPSWDAAVAAAWWRWARHLAWLTQGEPDRWGGIGTAWRDAW